MRGYRYRWIIGVAVAIALLASAVVGLVIRRMQEEALSDARRAVSGLAAMLGEQVQQSIQAIDLALNEVAADAAANSEAEFAAKARTPRVLESLANIAARRTSIDLISIEDTNGATLATSRGAATESSNPIYLLFDFLKNNRTRETQVGPLRVSEATGALVVDFMRRLETSDGAFLGVARVSVTPETLVSTYSPLAAMQGRSYALFSHDGSILARYPAHFAVVGQKLPRESKWYDVVARGGGLYETRSVFDGAERILAVKTLPLSQLVVTVAILRSTALAQWREQSSLLVLGFVLALMVAGVLVRTLLVQFQNVGDKEAALRAKSLELELSNQRFATALGNMSQGLVVFDRDGRVVISNERYATIYGLDPDAIKPGMMAKAILDLRTSRGVFAGESPQSYIQNAMSRRYTDQRIDHLNTGRSILVNHAACGDGGLVVTHEDVTEREQTHARIAYLAMHDELTQLANRALFLSALETLKRGLGSTSAAIVVMLIDLDNFKPVNDTFGHEAGDRVLRECALRILSAAPYAHVVARLGGDEFAIACGTHDSDGAGMSEAAARLISAISAPYTIDGQSPEVGACVGVAVHVDPDLSIDDMLRRADLALYTAKAGGANRSRLFEPWMELEAITRRELAADLAHAIDNDQLYLAYQPIVDADTMEIRQMEALLRWPHARRGLIPPQEFVRLAEEMHLIDHLGAWVIRRATADAAQWPQEVVVAVNVSPLQLASSDFAASVLRALEASEISPRRLEIEITESAFLQDKGDSLVGLHRLRDLGVSVALDDFGTGFSSLSYLKRFPFDRLKIDRSFVADAARDAGSAAIIAATVQLARAFEIEITAEGVETWEQYQVLRATGVRMMQGYLFGWPERVEGALPIVSTVIPATASRRLA